MADLSLEGVCKGWDFPVLDEVSLSVAEGEFYALVGPSGAGKTTMLRLVAGLETPDAGRVLMGGDDVTAVPPYRRGAAMTFESYALYPLLSVFENIASPLRARRTPEAEVREKVGRVAELLRITELLGRRPGEISGGQKQRTALGRTLVASPRVFLLDEPLSHLDAKIRVDLREQFHVLEELRRTATLYVTHDYAEALSLGDRVGVLRDGKLQQEGTPEEIFKSPSTIDVARQFGQPSINLLDVTLGRQGDALVARAGGAAFAVSERHQDAVSGAGALTMGIRPQHLRAVDGGDGGLPAKVEAFQSLGSYGVLTVDCQGTSLRVLTEPEASHAQGDDVLLATEPDAAIWFDSDGRAVGGAA